MPTYVYKCPIHGEFEVEQKITDAKLERCPVRWSGNIDRPFWCHPDSGILDCGQPVERLIAGGTSFVLNGSGWAKDGYK